MSGEVLEELVKQMFLHSPQPNFAWQGGEPTLMGLPFFQRAVELQKKYSRLNGNKPWQNSIQTNGTLLTPEWFPFFKENQFLVGLSLDGNHHVHNKYRKDASDTGSWLKVSKMAKSLLRAGVLVNALSTVNSYSVQFPEETYKFLKKTGFEWTQFIPIVENLPDGTLTDFSVDPLEYGAFLCKLFDLWLHDFDMEQLKAHVHIRYFESLMMLYVGQDAGDCQLQKTCGSYLVAEHNGDIYSCDFFVDPDLKLGNLLTGNLQKMFTSDKHRIFGLEKQTLAEECSSCPWLRHCYNGCIKDRIHNVSDREKNYFCESTKMFYSHADHIMKRIAARYKEITSR